MGMNLSSGLKICIATILILIVGQCSVQGENKWNIVKGTKTLSRTRLADINDPFQVCGDRLEPFQLKARLVTHPLGSYNMGVRIEIHTQGNYWLHGIVNELMFRDFNFVAAYEVQNVVLSRREKDNARETVEKNICDYFGLEESKLYNPPLFYIKFHYSREWWCDTYSGYDLNYMELDKCDELKKDYDAGSKYTVKISSEKWETNKCTRITLTKHNDKFKIEALSCPKYDTDSNKLRLITYHKSIELGHYYLSFREKRMINLSDLNGEGDKVRRLIRMRGEEIHKGSYTRISAQYLDKGYWACHAFTKHIRSNSYSPDSYEKLKSLFTGGWCGKFLTYPRPLADSETVTPGDMDDY